MTPTFKEWLEQSYSCNDDFKHLVDERLAELQATQPGEPLSESEIRNLARLSVEHVEGKPDLKQFVESWFGQDWAEHLRAGKSVHLNANGPSTL